MSLIKVEIIDQVGVLTLTNAKKRNALSEALVAELIAALQDFTAKQIRVVILRAEAGAPVWSAGHDVNELPAVRRDPLGWDDPLRHVIREIESFPGPVIAMIDGGVWGGAVETAFACDLIIASPKATFAVTPAKLGVPYNISGMLTFMNSTHLRVVKELAFTAKPISAERAERLGIVNHVVESAEIEAFTLDMAHDIAANAPLSIAVMKEQLRILAGAHPMTPQGFERIAGLRRIVYDSEDYQEGIRAFKEKRQPNFQGK